MTGSIYIHSYYTKSDNPSELKTSDTFTEQKLPTYNAPVKDAKVNTVTYYPNTVSGFKASAKTTNAIKLTWNKVQNADGYILYRYDPTTKKWGRIAKSKNNTYMVTNLSSATRYYFTIRAYKIIKAKEVLSADCPIIAVNTLLPTVTGLKASDKTENSINLTWNKVSNVDGYVLYRYDTTTKKWGRIAKSKNNTYMVTNLSSATRYYFTIRAYKIINGTEVLSADCPIIAVNTLLPTVTGLKAVPRYTQISLTWDKINNSDGYVIYNYNTVVKKWERLIKTASNINSYTLNDLTENKNYYFTIRAYKNINGSEVLSNNINIIKTKTLTSSITNLNAVFSEAMVKLSWDKLQGADSYEIFMYNYKNEKWETCRNTVQNSIVITDLSFGTKHKFGVKATGTALSLPNDDIATVEGITMPGIVHYTTEKNGNSLNLSWIKRKEADKYIIYTMLPGENWKRVAVTTETNYTLNNMAYDKYYVTVRAVVTYDGVMVGGEFTKKLIQNQPFSSRMYSDGDSIAYGTGSHGYSYAAQYSEKYNIELDNRAVAGGTLSSGVANRYHIAENVINNVNSSYDYIFLDGGINDYYTSAVLGEITPDETTEFDMTTTCGALESMLFYVKSTCENSKVYFLLPHSIATSSRTNNLGLSYMDYKTAIEEICNKYDVVIIDCYNCNLTSDYTSTRNGVHTNGDNIHPTEAGYKKFYLPIVEETIEKSLMINE